MPRMSRYVLELPRSWNEKLVALAAAEDVPPRTLLLWLLASSGLNKASATDVKKRLTEPRKVAA